MRIAARLIATMAVAFVLVTARSAGDTAKPADKSRKDESVNCTAAPSASHGQHHGTRVAERY